MEITSEDYRVGDRVRILGTDLNGSSPDNDIIIKVTEVDSFGKIINWTQTGSAEAGIQEDYLGVSASNVNLTGSSAVFSIKSSVKP